MLLVGLVGVAPRADRSGKIVAEFTLKVRVECPGQCRMYRRHTEFTHRLEHLGCSGNLVALREPTDPVLIDDAAPIATRYPTFIDTATSLGAAPEWVAA